MGKTKLPESAVIVPFRQLSHEALNGVIEHFIAKDGPDSSHVDVSFERKKEQVLHWLESGAAVLVYDNRTCSCTILSTESIEMEP